MKLILSIILLFPSFLAYATENLIILKEIQKSIQRDFSLQSQMKIIKTTPTDKKQKEQDGEKEKTIKPRQLSKGEKAVQRQLQANREKLQRLRGGKPGKTLSGKEKTQMMLQKNRQKIKSAKKIEQQSDSSSSGDWMAQKQKSRSNWQQEKQEQIANWEKEKKETIDRWIKARSGYLKRIPQYKKNLTAIPIESEKKKKQEVNKPQVAKKVVPTAKPIFKEVKLPIFSDYKIVSGAFEVKIKDQGSRPTCASFAGIRAIEILTAQQNNYQKLSEQFFYWSSKPKCKSSPCNKRGSWVLNGLRSSQNSAYPDIPKESDCPYTGKDIPSNSTQTPLRSGCRRGVIKIKSFSELNSNAQIIEAIKNDRPVISAFRLSKNFYRNTGYVFYKDKNKGIAKMDAHSSGHAVLLIGYMKLPKKLHLDEGRFCLITANSWGIGWGKGGHACLSERWIDKYRYDGIKFIALNSLQ